MYSILIYILELLEIFLSPTIIILYAEVFNTRNVENEYYYVMYNLNKHRVLYYIPVLML